MSQFPYLCWGPVTMQDIAQQIPAEHQRRFDIQRAFYDKTGSWLADIQRRRLNCLRRRFNDAWQTYLDIGIKFYDNIPLRVYYSEYDEAFEVLDTIDPRALRDAYDAGHDAQNVINLLLNFNQNRHLILAATDALLHWALNMAQEILDEIEDNVIHLSKYVQDSCGIYENLLAGTNALAARGEFPTQNALVVDQFAKVRVQAFETWSKHVQTMCRLGPDAAYDYAEAQGWIDEDPSDDEDESDGDSESDSDSDSDGDGDDDDDDDEEA